MMPMTSSAPSVTMVTSHCAAESEATKNGRLCRCHKSRDYWLDKLISDWSTFCEWRQSSFDYISNLMLRPSVHVSAWDHVTCSWRARRFQTSEWTMWLFTSSLRLRRSRSTFTFNMFRLVRATLGFSMPGVAAPCWLCGSLKASASGLRRLVWCSGVPDGALLDATM